MYEGHLFDRQITVQLEYKIPDSDEYQTFTVGCTKTGMKPNISVKWKRVPNHFCYECIIAIHNLQIDLPAIWAEKALVNIGYPGHSIDIAMSVFAAYQATPGPDAVTTYHCITASANLALFSVQRFSLTVFHSDSKKFTVRDVLSKLDEELKKRDAQSRVVVYPADIDDKIPLDINPDEKKKDMSTIQGSNLWLNKVFAPHDFSTTTFQDIYFLLNAIQNELNRILEEDGVKVLVVVFNHNVVFTFLEEGQKVVVRGSQQTFKQIEEQVPVLDLVSSADWNAGTLTITAPFNPHIYPGCLFKFATQYYTGGYGLPNSVARKQLQKDPNDVYYTITQEVEFGTHTQNQMTIMAVPMINSPKTSQTGKVSLNTERYENQLSKFYEQEESVIPIVLAADDEKVAQNKVEVKSLNDLTLNMDSQDYTVVKGDSLSTIVQDKFSDLPPLIGRFPWEKTKHVIPAYAVWYPVIFVLTNTFYKQNPKANSEYRVHNIADPDSIREGDKLKIPKGMKWKDIQQGSLKGTLASTFASYKEFYIAKGKDSWAGNLELAEKLLTEGVLE